MSLRSNLPYLLTLCLIWWIDYTHLDSNFICNYNQIFFSIGFFLDLLINNPSTNTICKEKKHVLCPILCLKKVVHEKFYEYISSFIIMNIKKKSKQLHFLNTWFLVGQIRFYIFYYPLLSIKLNLFKLYMWLYLIDLKVQFLF